MGSTLKPGGKRGYCDNYKTVFVQGAYNLGSVLQNFEVVTTAFNPGMFVIQGAATVGTEQQCKIGATGAVDVIGIAEVDFGVMKDCTVAYNLTDSAPIILYHWNWGALLRNVWSVDPGGDKGPGAFAGTTSGTSGCFKIGDLTTGANIRAQDFVANAASDPIVAWIENYSP